jgi:hypothetical protein
MGSIVGQDIREYVVKQINIRQKAHGSGINQERTLEELTYLNSNTAWIKLASGVSVTKEKLNSIGFNEIDSQNLSGNNLAKKFILFNGTSQLTDPGSSDPYIIQPIEYQSPIPSGYNSSPDYGIFPMAGIISLNVKSLNRGSLKKATLKLKVQDRQQLSVIDILYLRLGYTVLLEWGNSVFLDNDNGKLEKVQDTILEQPNKFFPSSNNTNIASIPYTEVLNTIDEQRRKYSANYDGMLCKVSNFSWTFNNDGSYDVDLTLISWGDVIESLKTNVTANKTTIDFLQENALAGSQANSVIEIKRKDNIIFSLLHTFKLVNTAANKGVGSVIKVDTKDYGNFILTGSNEIKITKYKWVHSMTSALYETSGENNVFKIVKSNQFRWFYTQNSDSAATDATGYGRVTNYFTPSVMDKTALYGYPFIDAEFGMFNEVDSGVWKKINLQRRTDVNNRNKYNFESGVLNSGNIFPSGRDLTAWATKGNTIILPLGSSPSNAYVGMGYTIPELYTRTKGNPSIVPDITLQRASKGVGFTDQHFKSGGGIENQFYDFNYGQSLATKPAPTETTFNHEKILSFPGTPASELQPNLRKYLDLREYGVAPGGSGPSKTDDARGINLNFLLRFPKYIYGVVGRDKDQYGNLTENVGTTTQPIYIGLQNKYGTDGGTIWTSTTPISEAATDPALIDVIDKDAPETIKKAAADFEAFKAKNATKLDFSEPKYDPATGLPMADDYNYEFFYRFVGKADKTEKPFFVSASYSSKPTVSSNKKYENPLKSLQNDSKGIFVLNLEPKEYYIKFGYLLYLIQEKVIFKIDEGKTGNDYDTNSSIININYSSSSEMFCINSENTGQISYDWKTCIVRRDKFTKPASVSSKTQKVFSQLDPWAEEDDDNSQKRKSIANSMNVYLNFNFVGQCFESNTDERGNIAVFGVISSICTGINKALGGVNNLEPVIDDVTNTLQIIDTTPKNVFNKVTLPSEQRNEAYLLKLYGYSKNIDFSSATTDILENYPTRIAGVPYYESTFARKVNLKTAITPEYATMITVGAAAGGYVKGTEATAFSRWNEGIFDSFKPNLIPGDSDLQVSGSTSNSGSKAGVEDTLQSYEQAMESEPACFGIVN